MVRNLAERRKEKGKQVWKEGEEKLKAEGNKRKKRVKTEWKREKTVIKKMLNWKLKWEKGKEFDRKKVKERKERKTNLKGRKRKMKSWSKQKKKD